MVEEVVQAESTARPSLVHGLSTLSVPRRMSEISGDAEERIPLPIGEFARVLGGGVVPGSIVLVGGDPGIGKSTLLMQMATEMSAPSKQRKTPLKVLYVSGEESAKQIKLRAQRIGALSPEILILVEISVDEILSRIEETSPDIVAIDSIQTMYSSSLSSAPGSVGQVRESAERLILMAKRQGSPCFSLATSRKTAASQGPRCWSTWSIRCSILRGKGSMPFASSGASRTGLVPPTKLAYSRCERKGYGR